jgi:hypothetical protein
MRSDEPQVSLTNSLTGKRRLLFFMASGALFLAFACQLWYHAVRTSATVDEPAHILAGYRHWQCGDFGINPEHPPMLKMLATVPLQFRTVQEPPWDCGSRMTSRSDLFLYGTKFLVENGSDELVMPARYLSGLFALALAIMVFAFVWHGFGRWEAITALSLLAFEPNLVANGPLVTTDMTLTATAFAAILAFYFYGLKPNVFRFCLAGLAVGLLLAAKHSAVIFVPVLFGLMMADSLVFRRREVGLLKSVFRRGAAFAGIFLTGLLVLWAFYGFRHAAIPNTATPPLSTPDYIAANGPPEAVGSLSAQIVSSVGQTNLFPESYVLGMADIVATGNRNMYLFDRAYPRGQWFYFPLSFLIKSSVALLLLLPLGFVFALVNPAKRREMCYLLLPAIVFFAVALTSGINIGVRHILPVYPFLIAAAAVGAVWLGRKSVVWRYVLIALLLYHAGTTIFRVAPYYVPFANDFWGGSDRTHKIYRDPNLDFGQNNKFVKEYLEREKITDCWFAPHGNFELVAAEQPCRLMPGSFGLNVSDQPREAVPPVIEGTILLTAMVFPPRGGTEYSPITKSEPVAVIGRGVFVYRGRFEIPLVAALSRTERAYLFVRLKRFDEALTDASEAVELAPNDPRPYLAHGIALLRSGHKDAAREALIKAEEALRANPVLLRQPENRARQELKSIAGN